MSILKLKDRIAAYEQVSDVKLTNRLPIIITINGKSFSKITSLLGKPYSLSFAEAITSTIGRLLQEVQGVIFAYAFNDEIILVARNDQHLETAPWLDNKIQKITSVVSALSSLHFGTYATSIDMTIVGDPLFISKAFVVPNITEAINVIVSKQQQAFQISIHFACFYELLKKYDKDNIKNMLSGLSIDEKINLLKQECNIDFNNYPMVFRRGIACYRAPQIIKFEDQEIVKSRWVINDELPIFTQNQQFLQNIFNSGTDILRSN